MLFTAISLPDIIFIGALLTYHHDRIELHSCEGRWSFGITSIRNRHNYDGLMEPWQGGTIK